MGLLDFLKRNKKKESSADAVIFEELKNFQDRKADSPLPATQPAKPAENPPVQMPAQPPAEPVYDQEARIREVSAIKDDQQLIRIIAENKDSGPVILTAIRNLSDPTLLVPVVEQTRKRNSSSDQYLRAIITQNVKDKRTLLMIANDERSTETRKQILSRIRDKEFIKKLLLSDENISSEIISTFVNRFKDQNELAEIFEKTKSGIIRYEVLCKIKDEGVLREAFLKNPSQYTYLTKHLKEIGFQELAQILEVFSEKEAALKETGGYICQSCGGENDPADGPVTCICKHCGAENHDWKHISNVTEYRDYAVGSTYDECTRCGERKNYKNVDYGFLE